ncbi:somatostatin 1.2 isoform X2 [Phyllopteryx taeniolatus]|uniref:somatostatin 1.2 isoform X2 n=1 Tax=Phyllopteryx taeniolatus TaxID=161469 RepID=UPI002AD3D07F|nr:somatostatin 1.2 isoform X2 [Phyllopteryx taeniolatus]
MDFGPRHSAVSAHGPVNQRARRLRGRGRSLQKAAAAGTVAHKRNQNQSGNHNQKKKVAMRGCERSLVPLVTCLLVCSLAVSSQPDRQQDLDLDLDRELELRHLKMPHQLGHGQRDLLQDWTKRAVEDLLARLSPPEAEIRQPSDLASARMDGERSVDPPNNGPPRERKAGCKNFYWKGFTSC